MIRLMSIIDGFMAEEYAHELKESCSKLLLLTEAPTGFTTSVHEIFVALALAGCKNPQNFKKGGLEIYTNSDIENWVKTGTKLVDTQKHIDELIVMRGKTEWSQTDKDKHIDKSGKKVKVIRSLNLWIEASKIASGIKKLYFSTKKIKTVGRVFGTGADGKNLIADVEIEDSKNNIISVSCKAGKHAQFTNLSPKNIINYLFPNSPKLLTGILNSCYKGGFKDKLDQGYQGYLKFVLRNYYDHRDQVLGIKDSDIKKHDEQMLLKKKEKTFHWNKNRPDLVYLQDKAKGGAPTFKEAKLLDEIAFHKGGGYQGKSWISSKNWSNSGGTRFMIGLSSEVKKALEHAYGQKPLTSLKTTYEDAKKYLVNETITEYLKLETKKLCDTADCTGLIVYILRAEPDRGYLYAGSSGNKLSFIPSEKEIRQHTYSAEIKEVSSADFVRMVKVYKGTSHLFTFDLKWRWGQGQWRGDLSQKGAVFEIKPSFWTVFTTHPAGRWPGT